MRRFPRFILVLIIVIVIAGLILPFLKLYAAEEVNSGTSTSFQLSLKNTDTENNLNLSEEEKLFKEISFRKETLIKIIEFSLMEINDLKEKLENLNLENEEQINIKNSLISALDENKNYLEQFNEKLLGDISLDEVKNAAQEFKNWREKYYNIIIKKALVFILVLQQKTAIQTADSRLEKIISDIKKLENAKLIKKEDVWKFLISSIKNLTNAHFLNSKAEWLLLKTLRDESSSLTATSTAIFSVDISSSTPLVDFEEGDEIKLLVEKSLNEIKNTYRNFLEISNRIRKKLAF